MSEYKKVKIGDFLTEREGRYKPDDEKISNYKRLEKIDFSGVIHISDKASKTDMIIVHPGDLVISGINVAKGAVAVYQGIEPVCATIHYSSYTFDDKQVDLEYFKYFVKSDAFISALQKQVKGGIKTEIKPKHLLPLEITIPDLETQKEIVKKVSTNLKNVEILTKEIESQKAYAKQLRQNILQDAIEGKLTAEWRKTHPVIKGNPDFDAEALFEEIQKEKKSDKKQKELAPIGDDEKPFEIPEGWKWVRLGEVVYTLSGYAFKSEDFLEKGKYRLLRGINLGVGVVRWDDTVFINTITAQLNEYKIKKNDIILGLDRPWISEGIRVAVYDIQEDSYLVQRVLRIRESSVILKEIIVMLLKSKFFKNAVESQTTGISVPHISPNQVCNFVIPLPPLLEQIEIVKKEDAVLTKIELIEKQIVQRKEYIQQLMQSILKDAFEER